NRRLPAGAIAMKQSVAISSFGLRILLSLSLSLLEAWSLPADSTLVPSKLLDALAVRSIGPAKMGGRITALAVVESDAKVMYVASASGGLWKTENNGKTWTPIFDKENTVSLGDVAVAPSNPDIVWVGTGEANPRNSVSWGDGVYQST